MMRKLFTILFLFASVLCKAQFGVNVDTASESLPEPPYAVKYLNITIADPGDTSALSYNVEAYWSLEETSGVTAYDSAASYDGTLINTPTQSQTGISNYCYSFGGETSMEYIDFGTSFYNMGTDDMTVSLWFTLSDADITYGGLLGNSGTNPDWSIRAMPGNYTKALINFGSGNIEIQTDGFLSTGVWYHLVFTVDRDGYMNLYINNVKQYSQQDISSYSAVDVSNSNHFMVGNNGNGTNYYHCGLIDEISIYSRLLTESEISQLYAEGVGRFWPYGGSGADSLNISIWGTDPRGDSCRLQGEIGVFPDDKDDGTNIAAYNVADSADWHDTTIVNPFAYRDTTYKFKHGTGLIPEDIWAYAQDTVFADSSVANPQDLGSWDTIWNFNFEEITGVPRRYTSGLGWVTNNTPDIFTDDWDATWRDSDHPWPNPGWWPTNRVWDSIVIDPVTGSQVIKLGFLTGTHDGYDGQTSFRGGDRWYTYFGSENQELYLSFNIYFGTDWDFGKGKMFGLEVGTHRDHSATNYTTSGSSIMAMFHPDVNIYGGGDHTGDLGGIAWYFYYPLSGVPGAAKWGEFQPTGTGLSYNDDGDFEFDISTPKWYNITMRIVCNTFTAGVANSDGIIEGFVNGKLIDRMSGMKWMPNSDDGLGINGFHFAHWFGGGSTIDADTWSYVDDFIVWKYKDTVEGVTRGQELSQQGRTINPPCPHKWEE